MSKLSLAFAAAALVIACPGSQGSLVTGVSSSNTSAVTVDGSLVVTNVVATSPTTRTADVAIGLTVLQKHIPTNLNFTFGPSDGFSLTDYRITLSITNALTPATGGTDYMNGFDIINAG